VQHFNQVRTGAAAGIEHDHVGIGEAIGQIQFGAKDMVDAGNLVLDDFRRGVPDAELFAETGIVGFEEWFVEILDGMFVFESAEKRGAINAV